MLMEGQKFEPDTDAPLMEIRHRHSNTAVVVNHNGEQAANSDDFAAQECRELWRYFSPVLRLMALLGLYHPSRRATSLAVPTEFRYKLLTRYVMIAAACCNVGYLLANFIVLIAARPDIDMGSLSVTIYIILLVWLGFTILLAILHFFICENPDKFDRIWDLWALWARIPRTRNWSRMRRIRNASICCALFVVTVPALIVGIGMSMRKPGELLEGLLAPVSVGPKAINHLLFTVDFAVMCFLIYGAAAFTTVFFVSHCVVITDELKFLAKMIGDAIDGGKIWDNVMEDGDEISVLEQLRRRRLECHDIVEAMDETFKKSAFLSVFANVPLIVFLAYGMGTHDKQNRYTRLMGVMAGLVSLMQVLVITVSAAWINQWADAPKKRLHALKIYNFQKLTRSHQASLSLFLSELTSDSIGITAWELAVITKEFVVTVFGLAVSYTIILVEFGHLKEVLSVTQEISAQLSNATTEAKNVVEHMPH